MEYRKFQIKEIGSFSLKYEITMGSTYFRIISGKLLSRTYTMSDKEGFEVLRFKTKNLISNEYHILKEDQVIAKISYNSLFQKYNLIIHMMNYNYVIKGENLRWTVSKDEDEIAFIVRKNGVQRGLIYELAILENEAYDCIVTATIILEFLMQDAGDKV